MADARLGLGPLPPAPGQYDRVNEQAFRQQMDSLRRSVEQYVAGTRNALEADLEGTGIGDLADVTETSVGDGEVLQFDNGTSEWINQTLAEAGISAVGHTHVEADITDLDHYNSADFDTDFAGKSTTDLSEGTNLYYTDARADARIALATLADLASADASQLDAGVLANARVQESNVTQHEAALSITESQISDLAHTTSAADLTSGELADARLSSNVPLLDASNTFTDALNNFHPATGPVTLDLESADSSCAIDLDSPAGSVRDVRFRSGGSGRWVFRVDQDAETGSNAGSSFVINRRSDAGANLGNPLSISRATGIVSLEDGLAIGGGQTIADSDNVPLLDVENTFTVSQTIDPFLAFLNTVGGSGLIYEDTGGTDRFALIINGPQDLVALANRAANGEVQIRANDSNAGSGGEHTLMRFGGGVDGLAFYGTAPIAKQTSVPVTAAGIHAALVNLGLIDGP